MSDGLNDRGKALEGAFFQQKDQELLIRLRRELETEEVKVALSQSSGIVDESLLNQLVELEIEPASFASFALLPLVEVAWADGKMQSSERDAILSAAESGGIQKESVEMEVLDGWLQQPPSAELFEVWKVYAATLSGSLSEEQAKELRDDIMGRARSVAEAAGGILGFGNKVSDEETEVLDKLSAAFSR